jgi:hypothetical protein
MKSLLFTISIAASLIASSNAATYVVSNVVGGPGDALFANTDNSLLNGGIVTMGYFAAGYSVSSTLSEENFQSLLANYTTVASAITGSNSETLGGSFAGYVEGPQVDGGVITGGNPLIGRTLYAFIGDASTLAASTSIAIFAINSIADDVPFNYTYQADPTGKEIVIGQAGTYTGPAGGDSGNFTTIRLVQVIPEPSTMLLGAIGALGLLRRRR